MNKLFTVCEECGKSRTFHSPTKTYDFVCCGKKQVADHLVNEDGSMTAPEPEPKPEVETPEVEETETEEGSKEDSFDGAPGLTDKDGDGDIDSKDVDAIVERVKAAE